MDAHKIFPLCFLALSLALCACGEIDPSTSVFSQTSTNCAPNAIPHEYVARWKDGRVTKEKAGSDSDLVKNFVNPNYEKLLRVEPNMRFKISLPPPTESVLMDSNSWGQTQIQAQAAWNQNINGQGVLVAVVDTGTDITHPLLKNNIFINQAEASGQTGVDDDKNGYVDDINGWNFITNNGILNDTEGHGTHVSGIIASQHQGVYEIGIAPSAQILPVEFIDANHGSTTDAINGIRYAVSMGAKVINASWGSTGCAPEVLRDEIISLNSQNVLFIAAAGNDSNNLSLYPEYPAAFDFAHQITVGASTSNNFQAGYSNFGPLVDLVAPGDKIYSTFPQNSLKVLSGTSMAAPFVSGVAALLWSAKPSSTSETIKSAIVNSVVPGPYNVRTRGLVNVANALKNL